MKRFWIPIAALCCCLTICVLIDAKPTPDGAVPDGSPPGEVKTRKKAMEYMKYYNHMDMDAGDEDMTEAIKSFQRMAGVNETGVLDNATMTMMNMDRCGVRDNMGTGDRARRKRYDAVRRWPENEITWRVNSFTQDIGPTEARTIMNRALQVWAEVANIQFSETTNPDVNVDFNIEFATGEHGDGGPFDGRNGVLAHAYFPNGYAGESIAGDAHFDDDEQFTMETELGINLFQVAAHEFGHSLGLGHSNIQEALMAPFYRGFVRDFQLHPDDVAGIQSLYGPNVGQPNPTMRPYPVTPQPGGPPCPMTNLDAIVAINDRRTFFLKGSQVWQINKTGVVNGYPKQISEVFDGLPNDVDAGLYYRRDQRTYFFKGSLCFEFYGTTLIRTHAIGTKWRGLPNNIDSAFIWSGNGRAYFTKGDQYYRYNPYYRRIDSNYPRPLSVWNLRDAQGQLLPRLDAAFQWNNNSRTYFFLDTVHYRFDDANFRVQNGYPRNTAFWWFGCGDQSYIQGDGSNAAIATVLPSVALLMLSAFLTLSLL